MVLSQAIIHEGRAFYYLSHYYLAEIGERSFFYGKGAEHFGIAGTKIERHDSRLKNLFQGRTPDGSKIIRRGGNKTRIYKDPKTGEEKQYKPVVGFDFTFSASKSVSVLRTIALLKGETKIVNEIDRALDVAVKAGLDYAEKHLETRTRSKAGGVTTHDVDGTFAVYEHGLSRDGDPQIHFHGVLINGGVRTDGEGFGTLNSKVLWDLRYTAGQVFLNTLRYELTNGELELKTYDIPFKEEKGTSFGIEGISKEILTCWSKRSETIKENTTPGMTGEQIHGIAISTRRPKEKHTDWRAIYARWNKELKGFDFEFNFEDVTQALSEKKKEALNKIREAVSDYYANKGETKEEKPNESQAENPEQERHEEQPKQEQQQEQPKQEQQEEPKQEQTKENSGHQQQQQKKKKTKKQTNTGSDKAKAERDSAKDRWKEQAESFDFDFEDVTQAAEKKKRTKIFSKLFRAALALNAYRLELKKTKHKRKKKPLPPPTPNEVLIRVAKLLERKDYFTSHQVMNQVIKASESQYNQTELDRFTEEFVEQFTTPAGEKLRLTSAGYSLAARSATEDYDKRLSNILGRAKAKAHDKIRPVTEHEMVQAFVKWHKEQREEVLERRAEKFWKKAGRLYYIYGILNGTKYHAIRHPEFIARKRAWLLFAYGSYQISKTQFTYLWKLGRRLNDEYYHIYKALDRGEISDHQARVLFRQEWERRQKLPKEEGRLRRFRRLVTFWRIKEEGKEQQHQQEQTQDQQKAKDRGRTRDRTR